MKQLFLLFAFVIGVVLDMNGQEWYSNTGGKAARV